MKLTDVYILAALVQTLLHHRLLALSGSFCWKEFLEHKLHCALLGRITITYHVLDLDELLQLPLHVHFLGSPSIAPYVNVRPCPARRFGLASMVCLSLTLCRDRCRLSLVAN